MVRRELFYMSPLNHLIDVSLGLFGHGICRWVGIDLELVGVMRVSNRHDEKRNEIVSSVVHNGDVRVDSR